MKDGDLKKRENHPVKKMRMTGPVAVKEPHKTHQKNSLSKTGRNPEVNFPIFGIGASAGGLEAFELFFKSIPCYTDGDRGGSIFMLGDQQWNIPGRHALLETILPKNTCFENFDFEHDFPGIGHRKMLLNARQIACESGKTEVILIATKDIPHAGSPEKACISVTRGQKRD